MTDLTKLTAAAVAAALQGAARLSEMSVTEGGMGKSPAFFLRVGEWEAYKNACLSYANSIRALIDPTGIAALEAYADKVRAEALEEAWTFIAAEVATWRNDVPMTGEECAAAILAMTKPTAKEGG